MRGRRRHVLGPRHDVVFPLERLRAAPPFREHERRRRRRDPDERHLLDVGAVGVARLEADLLELVGEIGDVRSSPFVPGARPSNSSDDSTFVCASTASMSTSGSWPIATCCDVDGAGAAGVRVRLGRARASTRAARRRSAASSGSARRPRGVASHRERRRLWPSVQIHCVSLSPDAHQVERRQRDAPSWRSTRSSMRHDSSGWCASSSSPGP